MITRRKPRTKKSFSQRMQDLAQEYMKLHNVDTIELEEVANWACSTGRYQRRPISMERQCKQELADALRVQHYTDPQGREVRRMHPVRIKDAGLQMVIWADIITAKPSHMRLSLQQSRSGIAADCLAHSSIVDSFNENNRHGETLDLFDYDFNKDVEERKLPTDYPDEPPVE